MSHAVEDKITVANDLCRGLEKAGLDIWYSGKELKAGDSLEKTIISALDRSKYGVVVMTPTYIEKNWTRKEYYLLMAKEIKERKVILPVLYNITLEQLAKYDIAIADKWAIRYDGSNMDHVIAKLQEVIQGPEKIDSKKAKPLWIKLAATLGAVVFSFLLYFGYQYFQNASPSTQVIEKAIVKRVRDMDNKVTEEHKLALSQLGVKPATMDEVRREFADYINLKTNFRNAYDFENGFKSIQSRKNVEAALLVDMDSLVPTYTYNLISPEVFLFTKKVKGKTTDVQYILINNQPLHYWVRDKKKLNNGDYEVSVSYSNNLRYFLVELRSPDSENLVKRHRMSLKGYLPVEKYVFRRQKDQWILKEVD